MKSLVNDLKQLVDGDVAHDAETLETFSSDFGQVIHKRPRVVVRPRSSTDVARVLRYASTRGIPVSGRAAGHSFGGQSLNQEGISLDLRSLNAIHQINTAEKWFQAGAGTSWKAVVEAALPQGLLPPVLTNFHEATLGGTHSAGGFGIASFRHGAQIDHCTALEVVTASGDLLWCDPEKHADLFHHVLGSFGQYGIITQVRHRLRPTKPWVKRYRLVYTELGPLLDDCRLLMSERRIDHLAPMITLYRTSRDGLREKQVEWGYAVDLLREVDAPGESDDSGVLAGLGFSRCIQLENMTATQFARWLNNARPQTLPATIHPSMDVILPWSAAREYISTILEGVPFQISPPCSLMTTVSVIPLARSALTRPMLRLPSEDFLLGFSIHPYVSLQESNLVLAKLRMANDLAFEVGGKRYLVGWLPFEADHWRRQFDTYWPTVVDMKSRYDSRRILNPGFCPWSSSL